MTQVTRKSIRLLLAGLGISSLLIAVVSLPLPGFPSSLFLLASVVLFARSSPRLESWLRRHRVLGPWINKIENRGELSVESKLLFVAVFWCGLLVSWLLFRNLGLPGFGPLLIGSALLVGVAAFFWS